MLFPESVQIQTIDYCNRVCPWCPNAYMNKLPDTTMSEETYLNILDDLARHNYTGKLHLYLMAEPLCDPNIVTRIKQARERFPDNTIFISTNGDFLHGPSHIKKLLDAGLTWMAISDYDMAGEFWYAAMFPQVVVTTLNSLKDTFYNRGGNVPVKCVSPKEVCEWVGRKAYVNYKGDMILCCSDYKYSIVFGNTNDTNFVELYNSQEYRNYRKMHSMGRGYEMPLCNRCNRYGENAQHDNAGRGFEPGDKQYDRVANSINS